MTTELDNLNNPYSYTNEKIRKIKNKLDIAVKALEEINTGFKHECEPKNIALTALEIIRKL